MEVVEEVEEVVEVVEVVEEMGVEGVKRTVEEVDNGDGADMIVIPNMIPVVAPVEVVEVQVVAPVEEVEVVKVVEKKAGKEVEQVVEVVKSPGGSVKSVTNILDNVEEKIVDNKEKAASGDDKGRAQRGSRVSEEQRSRLARLFSEQQYLEGRRLQEVVAQVGLPPDRVRQWFAKERLRRRKAVRQWPYTVQEVPKNDMVEKVVVEENDELLIEKVEEMAVEQVAGVAVPLAPLCLSLAGVSRCLERVAGLGAGAHQQAALLLVLTDYVVAAVVGGLGGSSIREGREEVMARVGRHWKLLFARLRHAPLPRPALAALSSALLRLHTALHAVTPALAEHLVSRDAVTAFSGLEPHQARSGVLARPTAPRSRPGGRVARPGARPGPRVEVQAKPAADRPGAPPQVRTSARGGKRVRIANSGGRPVQASGGDRAGAPPSLPAPRVAYVTDHRGAATLLQLRVDVSKCPKMLVGAQRRGPVQELHPMTIETQGKEMVVQGSDRVRVEAVAARLASGTAQLATREGRQVLVTVANARFPPAKRAKVETPAKPLATNTQPALLPPKKPAPPTARRVVPAKTVRPPTAELEEWRRRLPGISISPGPAASSMEELQRRHPGITITASTSTPPPRAKGRKAGKPAAHQAKSLSVPSKKGPLPLQRTQAPAPQRALQLMGPRVAMVPQRAPGPQRFPGPQRALQLQGPRLAMAPQRAQAPRKPGTPKKGRTTKKSPGGGGNHEVARLVDYRAGRYLVRWAGWGAEHDTWEPAANLTCPDLLRWSPHSPRITSPMSEALR